MLERQKQKIAVNILFIRSYKTLNQSFSLTRIFSNEPWSVAWKQKNLANFLLIFCHGI